MIRCQKSPPRLGHEGGKHRHDFPAPALTGPKQIRTATGGDAAGTGPSFLMEKAGDFRWISPENLKILKIYEIDANCVKDDSEDFYLR